jgi:hypothetical protein
MLDYETVAVHNLIVVAHDESYNEASVAVEIAVDAEPEWYSTGVFLVDRQVLSSTSNHLAVLIIPDDQETWENDPAFSQTLYIGTEEYHYTIVSADAEFQNPLNWGN